MYSGRKVVDWADLGQRSRLVAFPDKSADLEITLASAGSMADDLKERKFHPTSGAQVQVVPATNLNLCTFVIGAFPGFIGLAMGAFIAALKTLPIRCSWLPFVRGAALGPGGKRRDCF
jgi:hypothetical protein